MAGAKCKEMKRLRLKDGWLWLGKIYGRLMITEWVSPSCLDHFHTLSSDVVLQRISHTSSNRAMPIGEYLSSQMNEHV